MTPSTPEEEMTDFIKDFGLEVSGGDFTQEHFLKYQKRLSSLLARSRLDELKTLTPKLSLESECKVCVENEDIINERIAALQAGETK